MSGRCGDLVFVDGDREASAYVELSGVPQYTFLVWTEQLEQWSTAEPITAAERTSILAAFDEWARSEGISCQW